MWWNSRFHHGNIWCKQVPTDTEDLSQLTCEKALAAILFLLWLSHFYSKSIYQGSFCRFGLNHSISHTHTHTQIPIYLHSQDKVRNHHCKSRGPNDSSSLFVSFLQRFWNASDTFINFNNLPFDGWCLPTDMKDMPQSFLRIKNGSAMGAFFSAEDLMLWLLLCQVSAKPIFQAGIENHVLGPRNWKRTRT